METVFREITVRAPFVAELLINSIWQGLVLVAAVWLLMRCIPRLNASTRYGVWWAVMVTVAALPLFTSGLFRVVPIIEEGASPEMLLTEAPAVAVSFGATELPAPSPPSPAASIRRQVETRNREIGPKEEREEVRPVFLVEPKPESRHAQGGFFSAAAVTEPERSGPGVRDRLVSVGSLVTQHLPFPAPSGVAGLFILGFVGLGIGVGLARVVAGCARVRLMKRSSQPLPSRFEEMLRRQAVRLGLRRAVSLRASGRARVPTAIGFVRPVVLIPAALLDELTDAEIEQVVLHELAHLRRWDDWTNFAQRLFEAVYFFHPAVRLAGRQICLEREIACDDWVVSQTGRVRPYAVCLTRLVALSRFSGRAAPALGMLRTKSQFSRRIEALLNRRRDTRPRLSRLAFGVAVIALAAVLLQAGRLPLVFAVAEPARAESTTLVTLQPAPPRSTAVAARARVVAVSAEAYALAQATEYAQAAAVALAPVGEILACLDPITAPVTPVAPVPEFSFDFNFDFDFPDGVTVQPDCPPFFSPAVGSARRSADGRLRVSWEEVEQLLCMGIDAAYVRAVRETAFPDVTVGELMQLKTAGVEPELLENLAEAGISGYGVSGVISLVYHGVSAEYVAALTDAGVPLGSLNEIAALSVHGLTPEYARVVMQSGIVGAGPDALVQLHIHGVPAEFVKRFSAQGWAQLTSADLIMLRQYGVDPAFADDASEFPFKALTIADLVHLPVAGVTPQFLRDLESSGVSELTPGQVIRLREIGITPEFLRAAEEYGLRDMDVSDLAFMQNHGVTVAYLKQLADAGFAGLDPDDIADLRTAGVHTEYLAAVKRFGFANVSAEEIIRLRQSAVSIGYLDEFSRIGRGRLSPDELSRLRLQGVTAEYAGAVYAFGFDDASADVAIYLRTNGVSQAYLNDLARLVGPELDPEEIVALVQNGVTAQFVDAWKRSGRDPGDVGEMIRLRALGIRPGSSRDPGVETGD